MRMISVRRLGFATLTTPDLERQIAYYCDILGLQVLYRDSARAVLATKLGVEAIALEKGERAGLSRLALQAKPGADLAELARDLSAHGIAAKRRKDVSPGVTEALSFEDPKGTTIDLFTEFSFGPEDRGWNGIMPLKLGHVAYRVVDVQKVVGFYQDVLGFRASDWRGDYFAFLRCNPDHHTLNFVYDDEPALHHIAFEMKDWAEIQRACDFLGHNGVKLVWGPGRHVIGHNIACYHKNSDGVRVELFTEMDQMKDEELGYFDPRPWHQDRPQKPKVWGPETMRNYWGFGSERNLPGYR
jgi:catechol-2,3-dioxygenase